MTVPTHHRWVPGQRPHDEHDLYYDAMEALNAGKTVAAKRLLLAALRLNPDSVEAYVGLTAVYQATGKKMKAKECIDVAYEMTRRKFRKWPRELLWGYMENREYLRALCNKAMQYHEDGLLPEAEELYRLILRLNPNDNQGVRYFLAGLFARLLPEDVDALMEKGNRSQDWSGIERLLKTQNAKYRFWKEPKE